MGLPELRDWYETLSANWRLVRFDNGGTGLSQREPLDFSLDASVRDLETVLDAVDVRKAVLFAPANAAARRHNLHGEASRSRVSARALVHLCAGQRFLRPDRGNAIHG